MSQETIDSERLPGEIKDSYEEDDQLSSDHRPAQVQVEVGVPDGFDREAYARLISSSQPSQVSQLLPPIPSSEQSASAASLPQSRPTRKPFIWEEDIVPDSQELPDSASYKPSETASSKTEPITTQNTQTVSDGDLEASDTRGTQWTSSQIESQDTGNVDSLIAESESLFGDVSYIQGQGQRSSYGNQSVIEVPSIFERELPTVRQEPGILSSSSKAAEEPVALPTVADQPGTAAPSSTEFRTSTEDRQAPLVREPSEAQLPEKILDSSQLASSREPQGQDHHDSSVPFQTQSPSEYTESGYIPSATGQTHPPRSDSSLIDNSTSISVLTLLRSPPQAHSIPEFSQHAQIVNEDTQTLQQEVSPTTSFPPTQKSVSGFESAWEATRVASPTPSPLQSSLPLAASAGSRIILDTCLGGSALKVVETAQVCAGSQPLETVERSPVESTTSSILPSLEFLHQSASQDDIPRSQHSVVRSSSHRASTPTPPPQSSNPLPPASATPKTQLSRYSSPLAFNMEQAISGPSPAKFDAKSKLAEMMAAAKAKTAAKQAARAASSISPSPAPSPMLSHNLQSVNANAMLPVFTPIKDLTSSGSSSHISPTVSPDLDSDSTTLKILPLGKGEYIIPLPMVSYPRDIYFQTIRNYRAQRLSFLTDEVFDETLVREIENMISELDRLCDHQDLISEDLSTQRMEPEENQAKWAENVSTKCIFLAEFLPLLQPYDKHVVIMVRPGRMMEILESLFKWHGFVYTRADNPEWHGNSEGGPMRVTLLPTGGGIYTVDSAAVVIAFDSTAKSVRYLNNFRSHPSSPTTLAPVISLVVTHSVEHLEKCFPTNVEPIERKIKMVSCLSRIAEHVGKLDTEQYPDPPEAARVVQEFVVNGANGSWPIMDMPDIEGINPIFTAPQGYDRDSRTVDHAVQPPASAQISHSALKRLPVSLQLRSE